MRNVISLAVVAASFSVVSAGFADTVLPNNPSGDTYTNASGSNQGQAVGATGWYYNNVRNNGVVGINSTYPRTTSGSAYLETKDGPGGASSKADIEYLASGVNLGGNYYAGATLGTLGALNLTDLGYDWYRDSTSTNGDVQHPSFRILLDADGNLATINDRGGLVFERVYNVGGAVPTDTWTTENITASTKMWNFGLGLGNEFGGYRELQEWISGGVSSTVNSNSAVLGFSMGVGSGWGPFKGAVDNARFGFNGNSTTYNFETAVVPVPAAVWGGMALLSSLGLKRLLRSKRSI